MVRTHLLVGFKATLVFTVLTGLLHPLAVTGAVQVVFGDEADGSLITSDGTVVDSELLGQKFTQEKLLLAPSVRRRNRRLRRRVLDEDGVNVLQLNLALDRTAL